MEILKLYLSVIAIIFAITIPVLGILFKLISVRSNTKNVKKRSHDQMRNE